MTQLKRGRKAGFTHSDASRAKMSESHRTSPKGKRHLKRLHRLLQGRPPSKKALAGSRATRKLKTMGLTRGENYELWEYYRDMFLAQIETGD